MKKDEAKTILLNAAWLGTNETREKTEEAVRMAVDALSQQYDRKQYEKGYKDALKALKAEVKNSPYTKSYEYETEYIPKHRVYEIIDRLRKDGE